MNKLLQLLLLLAVSCFSINSANATSPALPEGGRLVEVHVLSVDFKGQQNASMVARPCDEYVSCENIFARINSQTTWRDSGQLISYRQARKLKWNSAVLVVDKHNNALMISRILTGVE